MNESAAPLGDALPPELLIAIVAINVAENPSYVLTALAVSRRWRAICLGAPSLWRRCILKNECATEQLAMWIEHSADKDDRKGVMELTIKKGMPVDILWELLETWRLSNRLCKTDNDELEPPTLSVTLGSPSSVPVLFNWLSSRSLPRGLRSLSLDVKNAEEKRITINDLMFHSNINPGSEPQITISDAERRALMSGENQHVETLENHLLLSALTAGYSHRAGDLFEHLHEAPLLEHLTLDTFAFVRVKAWPYTLLRSLHLYNVKGDLVPDHLISLLSQCPNIESLIIDGVPKPRSRVNGTAVMPFLKRLQIGAWKRAAYFLSHLDAPNLETLHLRKISDFASFFHDWINPSPDDPVPWNPTALRTLFLTECIVDEYSLAHVVYRCMNLEVVNIFGSGREYLYMMGIFARHPSLQVLRFACCSMVTWDVLRWLYVGEGEEGRREGEGQEKQGEEEDYNVVSFDDMPRSWKVVEDALSRGESVEFGRSRTLILKPRPLFKWDEEVVRMLELCGWRVIEEPLI